MAFTVADVQALAPGLPPPLAQIVLDEWVATGDFELAVAAMRQSEEYEIYFPGNRREDGSLRYNEATYLANMEAYAQELASVDLNPDLFEDRFVSLIKGSVSPREFASRVLTRADEIREYYAQVAGIEMTDAAIIGSIIDPNLNESILNREISVAEIGAEASMRDLNVDLETAERLFEFGGDQRQAAELFTTAGEIVPVGDILARRHFDPDDTFDLTEFLDASAFGDVRQKRRLQRLFRAETSSFSQQTVGQIELEQSGALSGLGPS